MRAFQCNICGESSPWTEAVLDREAVSCAHCGATRRMREVIYLATVGLLGLGLPLTQLPLRQDLRGLGMSDGASYTQLLEERLTYVNTWYHQEPRLDVTDVPDELAGRHDLVISSDVLEHVLPPVQKAFDGVARLLRPGGVFVLTVPCDAYARTIEHYPDSVGYDVVELDGDYAVDVTYADGSVRRAPDPVFHGGPGSTLEMRLLGLADIVKHLRSAGFSGVRVLREDVPEHGIARDNPHSPPILAYR